MIATASRRAETFELPLTLTGGLSADEADRRIAVALRAGDIGARALAFYLASLADSGGFQQLGFASIGTVGWNAAGTGAFISASARFDHVRSLSEYHPKAKKHCFCSTSGGFQP